MKIQYNTIQQNKNDIKDLARILKQVRKDVKKLEEEIENVKKERNKG